jgi:hypothetical protein
MQSIELGFGDAVDSMEALGGVPAQVDYIK